FQIISITAGKSQGVVMDSVQDSPAKDTRVRQALNYAIDKDTLVKTVYHGLTKPEQGQVIQADTFGFNPDLKPYPYDPAKAKQLLAAAGYPNGFKARADLWLYTPEIQPTFLFVQQQFKDIGVDLELNVFNDAAKQLDYFYGRTQRGLLHTT